MSDALTYGRPQGEAEMEAVARIHHGAFALPLADARAWGAGIGAENLRVLRRGNVAAAVAVLAPMGQFFGGRSVPTVGLAGVATDVPLRGIGLGTTLIRLIVAELHESGTPLSTLYPATMPVYRRAGFEVAGTLFKLKTTPAVLNQHDRSLPVRLYTPADRPAVEMAYRAQARNRPGYLDRGPYVWNRVFRPRGAETDTYLVEDGGEVVGYTVMLRRLEESSVRVRLTDLVAVTPRAASRLLTLLADEGSMVSSIEWQGSAADPLLLLIREDNLVVERHIPFMLRLAHVPGALEARGWPPGVKVEIHLSIDDEVLADNAGKFVLSVDSGRAEVRPGGEGSLRIHVRGLAALYSGHLSPQQLAQTGLCEGSDAVLEAAAAAFAGPAPSMAEMF